MPRPTPTPSQSLLGAGGDSAVGALTGERRRRASAPDRPPCPSAPDRSERALGADGIAGVVDLGGDPVALARAPRRACRTWHTPARSSPRRAGTRSAESWAPDAIVREVTVRRSHPGVAGGAATARRRAGRCRGIRHQGRAQRRRRARARSTPRSPRSCQARTGAGCPWSRTRRVPGWRELARRRAASTCSPTRRSPSASTRALSRGPRARPALDLDARHPPG